MDPENDGRLENKSETEEYPAGRDGPFLHETVQRLSRMIKDMEGQLERMLEINGAIEKDLDEEKKKTARGQQERNKLLERLRRSDEENISLDDLRAEVGHLGQERSRLATTIEELSRQLAESEQENRKLNLLAERMRLERDDTLEELQSVEAQFDHSMEIVSDMKTRLVALAEEREAVVNRMKVMETQLRLTEEQRESLRAEVDESRDALEEIRRQVADACVQSQRFYYQHDEKEPDNPQDG